MYFAKIGCPTDVQREDTLTVRVSALDAGQDSSEHEVLMDQVIKILIEGTLNGATDLYIAEDPST